MTTVTTIGSTTRKARKVHECACGGDILKGTRYERKVELVDGAIEVTKISTSHIHSFEHAEALLDEHWDRKRDEDWAD